ncbi:hypothetical protein GCM10023085_76260 [Actinomadura viridis]
MVVSGTVKLMDSDMSVRLLGPLPDDWIQAGPRARPTELEQRSVENSAGKGARSL